MIKDINKYFIPVAIFVAGLSVAGALIYINQGKAEILSAQDAAEKAIDFINNNIEENVTASLMSVSDEGEIYKIHLKIQETEYDSYITKDGKFLFSFGYNLEEVQEEVTEQEEETPEGEEAVASNEFAQCLTDKGMKFYGSKNCGWCNKEKELFGEALQYVTYIECVDEETGGWSEECQTAGIEAVPTWQLPDNQMSPGFKTLEQLAELSGCPLE